MFTFNHWYILFVGNKIIMEVGGSGGGGDTLHMASICVALKETSSHCNTLVKLVQVLENICFKYNSFVKSLKFL